MRIVRSRDFQFGLIVAATLAWALLPSASQAYTPEQQQACSGDAFRLCGPEIPDVDRVTACMIRSKEQLSPGCRVFFRDEPEPGTTAGDAGAPLRLKPVTTRRHVVVKPRKRHKPSGAGAS
jgi:hypothetical protein